MRTKQNYQILTFHTTTAAMAMEDYCHEQKIPGRLIPLPQEISAGCGLAWRMLPGEYEQEKDRIEKSGIVIESNIIIMILKNCGKQAFIILIKQDLFNSFCRTGEK